MYSFENLNKNKRRISKKGRPKNFRSPVYELAVYAVLI